MIYLSYINDIFMDLKYDIFIHKTNHFDYLQCLVYCMV